jgi:hypothetical protein
MQYLEPEQSHRNRPEGLVAGRALVVAGGQAAELLAAGDQVLDPVPPAVDGAVERPGAVLVTSAWDGVPDAAPSAVRAADPTGVALVARDPVRTDAGSAPAGAPDRPLLQQPLESGRLVALARRQGHRHRLAAALRAEVDLRREATLALAQRLARRVPPFAPAACWCARITVPSTKWTVQSSRPAASACRWTAAKIRCQTPARVHRQKRVYTVAHGPYRSGRSRQGAPVASFHRIALMICRSSRRCFPAFRGGSNGRKRVHSTSVNSCRFRIPHPAAHEVSTELCHPTWPIEDRP